MAHGASEQERKESEAVCGWSAHCGRYPILFPPVSVLLLYIVTTGVTHSDYLVYLCKFSFAFVSSQGNARYYDWIIWKTWPYMINNLAVLFFPCHIFVNSLINNLLNYLMMLCMECGIETKSIFWLIHTKFLAGKHILKYILVLSKTLALSHCT